MINKQAHLQPKEVPEKINRDEIRKGTVSIDCSRRYQEKILSDSLDISEDCLPLAI